MEPLKAEEGISSAPTTTSSMMIQLDSDSSDADHDEDLPIAADECTPQSESKAELNPVICSNTVEEPCVKAEAPSVPSYARIELESDSSDEDEDIPHADLSVSQVVKSEVIKITSSASAGEDASTASEGATSAGDSKSMHGSHDDSSMTEVVENTPSASVAEDVNAGSKGATSAGGSAERELRPHEKTRVAELLRNTVKNG